MFAEIAKPTPMLPLLPWVAIALLMPMTSPFMLTSAPPELPGLIGASVWMASPIVVALPVSNWLCWSPPTVIVR
ncbi:hypothetical protein D3C83_168110 [compost metagenome]